MIHGTHNALADSRNESVLIYINDELLPREDATISVFDSGYLVGDGVWEGIRLHHGVLCFINDHLDRLWEGAASIGMKLPFSREELIATIRKTLDANKMEDELHVRGMVTR